MSVRCCNRIIIISLGCLLIWLAAVPVSAAAATEPPPPGVRPISPGPHGYFEYSLASLERATGSLLVVNQSSTSEVYEIYAASATTSPVTGVSYGQPRSHSIGIASWIQLTTSSVDLASRAFTVISFAVTVPAGTEPGDYVGAIAVQAPSDSERVVSRGASSPAISLNVSSRVVIAVVVHVPGKYRVSASLGQVRIGVISGNRQVVYLPMRNTGNMMMKPYLVFELRSDSSGKMIVKLNRQLDTFLPHTSIDYPFYPDSNQPLAPGCYSGFVSLKLGNTLLSQRSIKTCLSPSEAPTSGRNGQPKSPSNRNVAFLVIVIWLLIIVVLILLAILLLFLLLARRKKRDEDPKGKDEM